ncbi:Catalase [Temnothorax longispinosus]|uniref:Catalase n=1 Tax=Temnothorax longispinosus TaxID=300112 RepID=A0A4S2L1A3_9HYME|nr:Catalase [Temnothorax longispinosus]
MYLAYFDQDVLAMVFAELIGAFIAALSILYIYYKFVIFDFWRKRGVFYIKPAVLTGNITALLTGKKQIGVFFHDIYMKYKGHRAIGMYSLHKPNLVVADLDLIKTVLTKNFASFHDRGTFCNEKIDPLSGHLFSMPGKKWRNLRTKMTPTFTLGKIKQMFPIVKECGDELANYLDSKVQMRDSIEMKDIFARYTTDVIMSTAFGIKSNCIEDPNNEYRKHEKKIFEMNTIWIALFWFTPNIMELFSIPITPQSVTSFFMNLFRENVEYRQAHNIIRHDFMDLLIQLIDKGYVDPENSTNTTTTETTSSINKLTMEEATAQSYIFFIAGYETSSTTGTFALYELAQHHDMQDKVCKEIDEMLAKHGGLTYDALNEMTDYEEISTSTNVKSYLYRRYKLTDNEHSCAKGDFNHYTSAQFGYVQTKVGLVSLLSKYKFNLHPQTSVPPNESAVLLTANGAPIAEKMASLTVGPRGPMLLQDFVFLDEMSHFTRERTPERVVHAKGAGAFGYFEVTHDITKYSKAKVFSSIGKKTPIAVRFSTTTGESGSADTVREPRGFAVKFYTEDGIWDIVGNNTPIFFIKDPIFFPSFVHTQKRNPATHLRDADMFWDFISLRTETTHQVMYLFSDRGIPDGYRHMTGYGSHTFKLVNSKNEMVYCKFHYKGQYPSWTLYIQVMTAEQAKTFKWNPFDLTKVWPHKEYPLIQVGKLVLNRNPENYFTDVEQMAFDPAHMAISAMHYQRDGHMSIYNHGGAPNYHPNSFSGPKECPAARSPPFHECPAARSPPFHVSGHVDRHDDLDEDDFGQATTFWRMTLDEPARERLVQNMVASLRNASTFIVERAVRNFARVDVDLAQRLTNGLRNCKV